MDEWSFSWLVEKKLVIEQIFWGPYTTLIVAIFFANLEEKRLSLFISHLLKACSVQLVQRKFGDRSQIKDCPEKKNRKTEEVIDLTLTIQSTPPPKCLSRGSCKMHKCRRFVQHLLISTLVIEFHSFSYTLQEM